MAGDPAHAVGDPRAAGAGRGRSRRLASDRPAGPARLCRGAGRARSPLTGRLRRSRPRPAAAPGLAPGSGGSRQADGRHHGPSGPSRTPVVPDGQWRAVPWVARPDLNRRYRLEKAVFSFILFLAILVIFDSAAAQILGRDAILVLVRGVTAAGFRRSLGARQP